MNFRVPAIVLAIAIVLVVPSAQSAALTHPAYAADQRGAILVQVTDTSINPLPAEVVLPALGLGVRLSVDGTVLVANVPDGRYLVQVRHEGYASDSHLLRVTGDTVRIDFVLSPAADERGRRGAPDAGSLARARLRYFIGRRTTMSPGTFLTRTAIELRGARTVSALLRDVPGVRVERVAKGRTILRSTEASGPGCVDGMFVFLDGAEMTPSDGSSSDAVPEHSRAEHPLQSPRRPAAGGPEGTTLPALRWIGPSAGNLVQVADDHTNGSGTMAVRGRRTTDIDRVKVSSLVAVEVYSSPGSAPPEFQTPGVECGIVLIWTAGA
ncbi:MAG: carboxypeptidase-like regulatory domain-containing protein [Gemmatimonadaceae bacterium]